MHPTPRSLIQSLLCAAGVVGLTATATATPFGYGYTSSGQLVSFDLNRPEGTAAIGTPVGAAFKALATLPGTNTLYAISVGSVLTQLYTVNATTGVLTPVGSPIPNTGTVGGTSYTLAPAAHYDLAVDPNSLAAGALSLRLVNDDGVEVRIDSLTGAIIAVDGTLQYSGGVPATSSIVGAAYSNNDSARASGVSPLSQVFYLDAANDNLTTIVPPVDPNLGIFTDVGSLSISIDSAGGFDILSGNTQNHGYAPVHLATAASDDIRFYTFNIGNGAGFQLGSFPAGLGPVAFAIADRADPALPVDTFGFSYTAAGQLFAFRVGNPGAPLTIGSPVGTAVKAVAFLPGTASLYSIDVGPSRTQLYRVNLSTGVRTPVGTGFLNTGTTPGSYNLDPTAFYGMRFDPTSLQMSGSVDIYLVNTQGQNLVIDSGNGQVTSVAGALHYAGNNPAVAAVSAIAFTNANNVRTQGVGAGTQAFYLDTLGDNLAGVPSDPTMGQFSIVGFLQSAVSAPSGLDIIYTNAQNYAFVTADVGGIYTLQTINLFDGLLGSGGGGFPAGFEPNAGLAVNVLPGFDPGVDTIPPTIKITQPAHKTFRTSQTMYWIRGIAADESQVAKVEIKIRGLNFRKATGTTKWKWHVSLIKGKNVIRVRAFDTGGNVSLTQMVTVIRR